MESNIFNYFIKSKSQDNASANEILTDLQNIKNRIDGITSCFDLEENSEMIESYIYELKALNVRYNYLIKLAKSMSIRNESI